MCKAELGALDVDCLLWLQLPTLLLKVSETCPLKAMLFSSSVCAEEKGHPRQ